MGAESSSLKQSSLKPGYFQAYSFSPVIDPPAHPPPDPSHSLRKDAVAYQHERRTPKNPELSSVEGLVVQIHEPIVHVEEVTNSVQDFAVASEPPSELAPDTSSPQYPDSTVDYSDVSAAREALKQRLQAGGKAHQLSNPEMLEAMYRDKRKKTQAKGGTGQFEEEAQQSVSTLVQKLGRAGPHKAS